MINLAALAIATGLARTLGIEIAMSVFDLREIPGTLCLDNRVCEPRQSCVNCFRNRKRHLKAELVDLLKEV